MFTVHYALQTCDTASNQNIGRYCSNDRSEITRKCVTSFLESVTKAAENKNSLHVVCIFDDHSSDSTVEFLKKAVAYYSTDNVDVKLVCLENRGIMNSIRTCYRWMSDNGKDLVYQVQDDYLFESMAITEMINVFNQLYLDTGSHSIVIPYNDPHPWTGSYLYRPTPRTVIVGSHRYWIQCYDTACTFMTSIEQFDQHWDLYETFLNFSPTYKNLEAESLNHILVKRGVLGVMPVTSVALHMQGELEKDPYIDWQSWWNSVKELP